MITSSASASSQPSSWARDEVKTAISLGLVPKDLQNNYNAPITRIEFTQLIMQLVNTWTSKGLTEEITKRIPNLENNMFLDTDAESVRYLATLGIVEGDGKGYFMPKDLLQRQQAAKILYKTADRFTMVPAEDIMISTIYRGYSSHEMPHSFKDSLHILCSNYEVANYL